MATTIHLLSDDLARTWCGLISAELPREQVTISRSKANCPQCHQGAIKRMYVNYAENTALPLRGGKVVQDGEEDFREA